MKISLPQMPLFKYIIHSCLLCAFHPCFAAVFDQSGQPMYFFFEDGNYAEFYHAILVPDIQAEVKRNTYLATSDVQDFSTGDLAHHDHFSGAAIKLQIHPKISLGLSYDQPFATHASYQYHAQINHLENYKESANIEFDSQNLTIFMGYQPNQNLNIYTGLSYQKFEGNLNIEGENNLIPYQYNAHFEPDQAWGWLAGLSYQIPELAFRTSLTYRSKIKHKNHTYESLDTGIAVSPTTTISTPQSLNFDIQTGLPYQNFLYSSLRWVNWANFEIQPPQIQLLIDEYSNYIPALKDIKIVTYAQDQWSGKIGIAHQWNTRWINALEVLWDSGTDDPASTLNPTNGYVGYGLANLYKINKKIDVSTAVYYLDFNKPRIEIDDEVINQILGITNLSHNSAWIVALKLGYHF